MNWVWFSLWLSIAAVVMGGFAIWLSWGDRK